MVKCSRCGDKAVARIPYAKLTLCQRHFTEYINSRVLKTVKRYKLIKPGSRVLAAVSGGKDSTTMLAILNKLRSELNFELYTLHIDLGIGEYSRKSREVVDRLARRLNIPAIFLNVKEILGLSVPELAVKARRPYCSVCGIVKRYLMNATAVELNADVIATGHNLDDMVAYAQKEFLNQNLEALKKLGPKTPSIEGLAVGKIRPLYETYEREALIYALVNSLGFVEDECPYARDDSLENILKFKMSELEGDGGFTGIKLSFIRRFASNLASGTEVNASGSNSSCSFCGLLASSEVCSYCKLTNRVLGSPKGKETREYIKRYLAELL